MFWRHSKFCFIEPGATGLRGAANILLRWKEHEHDNKYPSTHYHEKQNTVYRISVR